MAKNCQIPTVIVGHITKQGQIAGPKLLEHMVDVVLLFSGEQNSPNRLLRAEKNRFGSTDELGIFEMSDTGAVACTRSQQALLGRYRPWQLRGRDFNGT